MDDITVDRKYQETTYKIELLNNYLEQVLQLEAVGCKDWLTNKVDRCVGGRVAKQQCAGPLQLPLNNCGVMALDFKEQYCRSPFKYRLGTIKRWFKIRRSLS